ncbi:hypothetical protein N9L76_09930 [bacterium]|nr:hypothetical protein [bacterium]
MATQVVPNTARPLGRQLGRRGTCRSSVSLGLRRRTVPSTRRVPSFVISPVALDRNRDGGIGGDDGELNTNVLYERMKALQEKESGENTQIVEAAIEKDQAIVAGIRGDAAERRVPERKYKEVSFFPE